MNKLHRSLHGRLILLRDSNDRVTKAANDLADALVKNDIPVKLLRDLNIRKVTPR